MFYEIGIFWFRVSVGAGAGETSVFEIENGALFARVAASLRSGFGRYFVNSKTF